MSTFVIDDHTYYEIEYALTHSYYSGNGQKWQTGLYGLNISYWDEKGAEYKNPNNKEYYGIRRFVGVLRANNIRAYNSRYRFEDCENRSTKYKGHNIYQVPPRDPIPPVQLLKSLQCIKYNSDDHQNKHLDILIDVIRRVVVETLPEWRAANWG